MIDSEKTRNELLSELEALRTRVAELQQTQNLADLGKMVSVVAHEIRNPLQNISMAVDAIRREVKEDRVKLEILQEIDSGVNLLSGIVRDLLDYSRPVKLEYSSCSIRDLVENALYAVRNRLHKIIVSKELEGKHEKIFVDVNKTTQVLVNIMSNAVDAMPEGGSLRIFSEFFELDGKRALRLRVSDSGCGIAEELLDQIQQPFFTTKKQGTGLGISICRNIVEAHNGILRIKSRLNQGTTVEITLPAKR